MKYPIGIQSFETIIEGGYVYLDKTGLVYDLVNNGQVYFLSRPRRFGKSLLISTLKCYFEGKKELFKGLAIDSLEKEWNQHPVFHLSFGGQNFVEPYTLDKVLEQFVVRAEATYGRDPLALTLTSRFQSVLRNAHTKTGLRTVVLIDEYDKPLLDVMDLDISVKSEYGRLSLEDYNRNILKGFYSVFKEADADLRFVLLTGVTKFSQVSVFSGFNQPDDISMDERYEALCGITEEELYSTFDEQIKAMAVRYKVSEDEMKYKLKRKFDGYHFSPNMLDIYNPFSVLNTLNKKILADYWFATGTPTYLVRLLSHCKENLNELTGKFYPRSSFTAYNPEINSLLPLFYQNGYLTIKDWNMEMEAYLLDFPNEEVECAFNAMLENMLRMTEQSIR